MPELPPGTVTVNLTQPLKANPFSYGVFGPGDPLAPIQPNLQPTAFDYPVAVNTSYIPRHTEPLGFGHLRAFANIELVRMAIETRKDQLERLDWMVKPKDNKKARSSERDPRCREVEKFLYRPNGVDHFSAFFRKLDEDLLAIDAPCLERQRTRGGKLVALEYVDGATINLLIDTQGRRPRGPEAIAYQQIRKGVVWANLANKDLIYAPRNVRGGHIYGMSPVEQIIVTINTLMQRQISQLAYFTEGNVPAGFMTAPDGWQNEQIRDLQTWWNDNIAGNQGEKRKIIWGPAGANYQNFKDPPLKDDFDEWLARNVAFAFSLPPTPFVRQMNKGTAGEDQERALEEGLEPLKMWRKRLIDQLIEEEFGYDDLEFVFKVEREIDPKIQSDVDDKALRNGSAIIDEIRDQRGLDPLPDGLGAKPMVYTSTGVVTLEEALKPQPGPMIEPPQPAHAGDPEAETSAEQAQNGADEQGKNPAQLGEQDKKKVLKVARKRKPLHDGALALSIDRPSALKIAARLRKAIARVLAEAGKSAAEQISAKLDKAERDPKIVGAQLAAAIDLKLLLGLEEPLQEELEAVGVDAVTIALGASGVDDASSLVDRVNPRAVAYAKDRAAELVSVDGDQSLIVSTRNMLRDVIANGLAQNIGRDAIAENVREAGAFSETRADLIANTEIANANAVAKAEAWKEVEADGATIVKEWFVSGEEGVCDECEGNADQGEIAFDEAFDSGDEMEPAHPGCRCVTTARILEPGETEDGGEEE